MSSNEVKETVAALLRDVPRLQKLGEDYANAFLRAVIYEGIKPAELTIVLPVMVAYLIDQMAKPEQRLQLGRELCGLVMDVVTKNELTAERRGATLN